MAVINQKVVLDVLEVRDNAASDTEKQQNSIYFLVLESLPDKFDVQLKIIEKLSCVTWLFVEIVL